MVYPENPATYWSFEYLVRISYYKSAMPPLGLLTVAAMLPENFDVKLIDINTTELTLKDIENADLVLISAMIIQKESFDQVVQLCRKCHKPVVAGGPYATSSYKDIKDVDYFVLNEGEVTLPKFIQDYEKGCPQKIYWDETKPDLAKTPAPRFDLIDVDAYAVMVLQFSRGCPHNCEFCDIREMFGNAARTKSAGQFIHEMECLYNTGFRGFIFVVDDNFTGARENVKELLSSIIKWQADHDYPFIFLSQASLDIATDDALLDLLREARFCALFIGIETPCAATLSRVRKKHIIQIDMLEAVKKIQSKGIEVMGGFILGFDTDPEDIFDSMINFIQEAAIPEAMLGLLNALPSTTFYKRMEQEGRISGECTGDNLALQSNLIPIMPKEKLVEGFKHVLSEIYSPTNYFDRLFTLITRFPRENINRNYLAMGMHITHLMERQLLHDLEGSLKIGMFSLFTLYKSVFNYYIFDVIKLLIKVSRYNHRYLSYALYMTARGYHFIRIAKDIVAKESDIDQRR
jgi:radical SAM superfamily enzyme YgiQ (UPF0313 family)